MNSHLRTTRHVAECFLVGFVAALIAIVFLALPASAQEAPVLSVPIDTVVHGDPNSTHLLATRDAVDNNGNSLSGFECDVLAIGDNNSSVHPGNDLIVTTTIDGKPSDLVVIPDFERAEGAVTEGRSRLTIGETLSLFVKLGNDVRPDGLVTSSGGATVQLVDYTSPPPPTVPTTTPTPTTAPPVTTPPTTVVKLGPPTTPVVKCVDNPDTPNDECGLPRTGSNTGPAVVAFALLVAGSLLIAGSKRCAARGRIMIAALACIGSLVVVDQIIRRLGEGTVKPDPVQAVRDVRGLGVIALVLGVIAIVAFVMLITGCGANDERGIGDAPVGERHEEPRDVWVMPDRYPNLVGVCIGSDLVLVTTRNAAPVVLPDNEECAS